MPEPKFTTDKLFRYPHMFPLDIAIWERFLEGYADLYTGFDYDIKVGTGAVVPEEWEDNYKRMAEVLSKYRIDVVGHKPGRLEIIEVKPEASTVAIGQIVTYMELYRRDFSPSDTLVGVIVTDREVGDIRLLTEKLGFDYYIV
jgi:hypothetical protein